MAYSAEEKQKIFDDICYRVINDKISFNESIEQSPIVLSTFYVWLKENANFEKSYNYAREIRSDILFEEIIKISDTTEFGETVTEKPSGTERKIGDMTEHRRLKIDARKWVVSRMNPKKYGDKVDLTSGGEKIQNGFPTLEQFYGQQVEKPNE